MEETKFKELLKEAFNKGRDYQYDINPYSGKLKENSKALTFTKWYNQVKNINVIPCCKSDSEQLVCEKCNGTGGYSYVDKIGFNYKACECQTN